MVSFQLTCEQKIIQKLASTFSRKELAPIALGFADTETVPWEVIEKAFNAGLMNLKVPVEYGGQGMSCLTAALIAEEMAYGCLDINGALWASELALAPLILAGTEEQKHKYLPDFCFKPQLAAFALAEPEASADLSNISTTAERHSDEYVLNGCKCFITNGDMAALYTVFAKVDRAKGQNGIGVFIVPGNAVGLSGGNNAKMPGYRARRVSELILNDVRLPLENLLGKEGDGLKIARQTLEETGVGIGAAAVGLARRALDETLTHCRQRSRFGRPLISNQGLQLRIADMAMQLSAARLLVWQAAEKLDLKRRSTLECAVSKCFAIDMAVKVVVETIQLMGGFGYMRDCLLDKLMRDIRMLNINEGANQTQKMIIAAELAQGQGK